MKSFTRRMLLAAPLALLCAAPAAAQEKVIGFAVPNLASSFWISSSYGVEDEAARRGAKLIKLNASGDANSAQQIAQLQDLIQRKVDVIIVGATNGDAVRAVVEQAVARGIPVIGLSSPPNTPQLAAVVSADHYDMGRLQARCLGGAVKSGQVAMVAGPSGQLWADQRALGFKETLAKEFPGLRVVAENRLGDNRNAALNIAEDWMQRFPDLSGVYAATDDIAAGVVAAVKAAKRARPVHVSASNFSPTAQQLLKGGELVCVSIQQIVSQGRLAARLALDAAAQRPIPQKVVALPALLVTSDNVASVDLSGVVAPATYRP
jgi:ABC-type sugar transport system substrate-binding protein